MGHSFWKLWVSSRLEGLGLISPHMAPFLPLLLIHVPFASLIKSLDAELMNTLNC